jgi:hypothetical protein
MPQPAAKTQRHPPADVRSPEDERAHALPAGLFKLPTTAIVLNENHLSHKIGLRDWRIIVPHGISPCRQDTAANASDPVRDKHDFPPV